MSPSCISHQILGLALTSPNHTSVDSWYVDSKWSVPEFFFGLLFSSSLKRKKKYMNKRFCCSPVGCAFVSEVSLDFVFSQLLFLLLVSAAIKVDHAVN